MAEKAELVGITFVQQYYTCFFQFPENAYKYYQDISVLSRPGLNGVMTSVTSTEGINDTILALGNKNIKAEIFTTDAQLSHKEGIIVLVTGCLTGKDSVRRKFTQSFFLAPQDKGYFVLNDVFRYINEEESVGMNTVLANGVHENVAAAPLNVNPEPNHALHQPIEPNHAPHQPIPKQVVPVEEATNNEKEVSARVKAAPVTAKKAIPRVKLDSKQNGAVSPSESASSKIQVDSPKKISYASMVMKDSSVTAPVHVPASDVRTEPAKTEQKLLGSPAPEGSTHSNNSTPKSHNDGTEVKSYCVHVRNLPLSARPEHVERIFKKYGTIKQDGIQVRSYKNEGTCFAFVDFETSSDMEKAIKASPVKLGGGREVTVEEKKPPFRGSNRDRNPPRRDGFRNDQIRDLGNFGGSRGQGRNESRNRESSGRSRGYIEVDAEGWSKKVYQNEDEKVDGKGAR